MTDFMKIALSVGIPAIVSIVGFIITITSLKKNFQNEVLKQKTSVQLDKMSTMPYEILAFLQDMLDTTKVGNTEEVQKKHEEKMQWLFSSIFAYGSSKAMHVLASMQSENYQNAIDPEKADKFRMMTFYILLAAQIRFDITGEIVSPEEWFRMKIKDFQANREKIKVANNQLVSELGLNKEYLMV